MRSFDSLPNGAPVGSDRSAEPTTRPTTSAGFGSPGTDATVHRIDLNEALIRHQQATFVMRAAGNAMVSAGIANGDVLLVDRAIVPTHGNIVIAAFDGELTCRRLYKQGQEVRLCAAAEGVSDIVATEDQPFELWGVVTTVIKSLLG